MIVLNWSVVRWLLISLAIVLAVLKFVGVLNWMPWWLVAVPVLMAYWQLLVIGIIGGLLTWAWKVARSKSNNDDDWIDA